jgi:monoamine oxidase
MAVVDVVVIGAGVAGLGCARDLVRRGLEVVVLEARDRIGGRIATLRLPGQRPIEVGAQVIHGALAATWSIIREAGLQTSAFAREGEMIFGIDGDARPLPEVLRAGTPPWAIESFLCRHDPPDRPVVEVLTGWGVTGLSQVLGLEWLAQTWCADPRELSAAGICRVTALSRAGRGEFVLDDGYDQLTRYLANGVRIQLGMPVERVCFAAGRVEIVVGQERLPARAVVITVPPSVVAAGGLLFEPALPAEKDAAARAILVGDALVVVARLAAPAPRSAWAFVVGEAGGFWRVETGSALLMGWMKGPTAGAARKLAAQGELIMRLAAPVFPQLQLDRVSDVRVFDWGADPYTRGGYSYPRAGALDQPRVWAAPVQGTLFFAGEATCADGHLGLVHGALESGLRAAQEVAAALGG